MKVDVTSVSTKGQVVIPGAIRKRLGIAAGSKLMVLTDGENVLMRPVPSPQGEIFRKLVDDSRMAAAEAGLSPASVSATLTEVRGAGGC